MQFVHLRYCMSDGDPEEPEEVLFSRTDDQLHMNSINFA